MQSISPTSSIAAMPARLNSIAQSLADATGFLRNGSGSLVASLQRVDRASPLNALCVVIACDLISHFSIKRHAHVLERDNSEASLMPVRLEGLIARQLSPQSYGLIQ